MKEQLITLDTAQLAKEKGFDIESNKYYNHPEKELWTYTWGREGLYPGAIFAPTQSLLQKWLRDVHNIDIQSYLIEMVSNGRQLKQDLDQREYMYRIYEEGVDTFIIENEEELSYEEALEKGLQEALNLIK